MGVRIPATTHANWSAPGSKHPLYRQVDGNFVYPTGSCPTSPPTPKDAACHTAGRQYRSRLSPDAQYFVNHSTAGAVNTISSEQATTLHPTIIPECSPMFIPQSMVLIMVQTMALKTVKNSTHGNRRNGSGTQTQPSLSRATRARFRSIMLHVFSPLPTITPIVPGKHDFYYRPERLRGLADFSQPIGKIKTFRLSKCSPPT